MRVDVLTIFPGYLAPLGLSLPGKARESGLLDLRVHDLRSWTHDRHRTVDDAPYGGGAGMVMTPGPWGEAFDALGVDGATVVVPTPAGVPFSQALARELASRPRLVLACGRYEGIDQRVVEHARTRAEVFEVSLGDYVLNGGEAAALAILEAVVRLLPGVLGNADSLTEESHASGLLEAPSYTRPPVWRGLEVPTVLLGGDHQAVARWRREASRRRTARNRPDLAHPSTVLDALEVRRAVPADAGELLTLQRACWVQEAVANGSLLIPPLHDTLDDVVESMRTHLWLVLRSAGRLVGAVRARSEGGTWAIGRLMVAPDLQRRGLGRMLLERMEGAAPAGTTRLALFTGAASARNLRLCRRAGYRPSPGETPPGTVLLTKRVPAA